MIKNFPYKRLNDFLKEKCNTQITRATILRILHDEQNESYGFKLNGKYYQVEKINKNKYDIGFLQDIVSHSGSHIYIMQNLNDNPLSFKGLKQFIKGLSL